MGPVRSPYEQLGGSQESDPAQHSHIEFPSSMTLRDVLLRLEYLEKAAYTNSRGEKCILFADVPDDLEADLPSMERVLALLSRHERHCMEWAYLRALRRVRFDSRSRRGEKQEKQARDAAPLAAQDAANRALIRYSHFSTNRTGKLEEWYTEERQTWLALREKVNVIVEAGAKKELKTVSAQVAEIGLRGHKEALKTYKKELQKYKEDIENGLTHNDDGTLIEEPVRPIATMESYEYQSNPSDVRDEDHGDEPDEIGSVGNMTDKSTHPSTEYIIEAELKELLNRARAILVVECIHALLKQNISTKQSAFESAQKSGDLEEELKQKSLLNAAKAEAKYFTHSITGGKTTRGEFAADYDASSDQMSEIYQECKKKLSKRRKSFGIIPCSENLGIDVYRVLSDQGLEADMLVKIDALIKLGAL